MRDNSGVRTDFLHSIGEARFKDPRRFGSFFLSYDFYLSVLGFTPSYELERARDAFAFRSIMRPKYILLATGKKKSSRPEVFLKNVDEDVSPPNV